MFSESKFELRANLSVSWPLTTGAVLGELAQEEPGPDVVRLEQLQENSGRRKSEEGLFRRKHGLACRSRRGYNQAPSDGILPRRPSDCGLSRAPSYYTLFLAPAECGLSRATSDARTRGHPRLRQVQRATYSAKCIPSKQALTLIKSSYSNGLFLLKHHLQFRGSNSQSGIAVVDIVHQVTVVVHTSNVR